jgi:hypothetical protein
MLRSRRPAPFYGFDISASTISAKVDLGRYAFRRGEIAEAIVNFDKEMITRDIFERKRDEILKLL